MASVGRDTQIGVGAALLIALMQLTDRQRHAIVGRYWRDLNVADVADELGITYDGATQLLGRAMEQLRVLLEPYASEIKDAA